MHEYLTVVIGGEQWAKSAVNKARNQNLFVRGLTFTFGKAAWETAGSIILFPVINSHRHEVGARNGLFGCRYCGKQYGIVHSENNSAVGLLGNLSCFN